MPQDAARSRSKFDPAYLDSQYNNRARIPEHPEIFARWATASTDARLRLARRLDIRYGDGPNETLDVFPTTSARSPVLVFIHGGWWRALDKSDFSFIAPEFVRRGATVVVPNYALCPAVTVEAITLQMVKALAWTHRYVAQYGGDPARIVVAGHSAGGHLAAMMVSCAWSVVGKDLPRDLVKRAMSISGVFDLEPIMHAPFLQDDLRLTPAAVKKLSPAYFPRPRVPLYAVAGALEAEEFQRQNRLIRDAWGIQAVPVCEAIPNTHHLNVVDTLAQPSQRLHQLTLELLEL